MGPFLVEWNHVDAPPRRQRIKGFVYMNFLHLSEVNTFFRIFMDLHFGIRTPGLKRDNAQRPQVIGPPRTLFALDGVYLCAEVIRN